MSWLPTLVLIASGALLGVSGLEPACWPLAWLGIGGFAWGIVRAPSRGRLAIGLALGMLATHALWLSWTFAMGRAMLPEDGAGALGIALGTIALATLPTLALTAACALVLRARFVWLWLPLAAVAGERLQAGITTIPADWIFTQVEVSPVMDLLAHLGLWPASLIFVAVAVRAGEALARRSWRAAWPAAAIALVALLAPTPSTVGAEALAGVGVVHAPTRLELPDAARLAPDLALIVWPEAAFARELHSEEGTVPGVALDHPLGGPRSAHLAGFETLLRCGRQNSVVTVEPSGRVAQARAKRALLPVFERSFLGIGSDRYVPGEAPPLLAVAERQVIPLICGEVLDRALALEGRAAGGVLLAVLASDHYQAKSALARRHVLTIVRLRAIELGVPAVYASLEGQAAIIAADGEILAESAADAPAGILTWSAAHGARDRIGPMGQPPGDVLVLFSRTTPHLRPDCPAGRCVYRELEGDPCAPLATPVRAVVVAGHAAPPEYLGRAAAEIAAISLCHHAEVIVLDMCFGASEPLFEALAARGVGDAVVVAPLFAVPARGLRYGAPFFETTDAHTRAAAVGGASPGPMFRGRIDRSALARARESLEHEHADTLRGRVRRWIPTLVAAEVAPGAEVLFGVDWRRIGQPPRAPH